MFCPKCGKKVEENTKFCSNCGAMLKTKPNSDSSLKSNQTNNVSNLNSNPKSEKPKKKTGLIIAIVLVLVLPVILFLVGATIVSLSENWAPIETFPEVETRGGTFNSDFNVTTRDDYTYDYNIDGTESDVKSGTSKIKEFSFGNEYCNNTYMYTYADGAFADWSDGDIITLSGSALLDKSMNDNSAISGYVDGYVDGLELIESINSEDVTVNITDNGDYISASFTFSNLSGNANSNYVNAVAKWFGVSTVGGAIKDSDLSACLENSGYSVKGY